MSSSAPPFNPPHLLPLVEVVPGERTAEDAVQAAVDFYTSVGKSLGNITASWGMLVQLARLQEAGIFRDEHSSLAKVFVTSRMREVVGWSREIFGGNGILLDHDIPRFFADAEAIYSFEGTREMHTLIVGKSITGRSAFV